ncbi:phosphate acyltransferase PlsX [Corticibacter populi]|uniref:Phosphate acyltransferase n=1 Tax=Corticibacter populi TaxID=1550736 RepID=A0A3M6QJ29_9BURK|nr:phosphate acyltransferase PlsX [Corticibacter populi]RMX03076.1 phosphate acyltransferase PlsX [Corticibacter populi]RZS33411.1 phosphate:acyl-[acyl carrier protein] acyltransferase [Corticibacter populi]
MTTLAVDCMGGDFGPAVTLPACRRLLDKRPDVRLLLVGQQDLLASFQHPRAEIVHAAEVVAMDDPVEVAMRHKKQSSMRLTLEQVKNGRAQAAVSAGNTGALMAIARYLLKTLDGIERPAIAYPLPNVKGGATTVLDLGANVDCTEHHLLQFAVLGSALDAALKSRDNPSVGLLNVGSEAIKGSEMIKRAGELLRQAGQSSVINFYGNVEGNDIFKGTTDIVVCDGFVGNVTLKATEGLASMVSTLLKQEFSRNLLTKAAALVALPVLNAFKRRVDPRRHNGAALLGLRGLVFKSHGSADAMAFEYALGRALDAADNQLLDKIQRRVQQASALF